MSEDRMWVWWAGLDGERYQYGPCATRDEVVKMIIDAQGYQELEPEPAVGKLPALSWRIRFHVVEATQHTIEDVRLNGVDVIERLTDQYEDWVDNDGDGELFNYTDDEERKLGERLTAVIREWGRDKLRAWAFADQRNEEWVEMPHPQNDSDSSPE